MLGHVHEQGRTGGFDLTALGIEVLAQREDLMQALSFLVHRPTWLTVAAERAVSRAMGGSCSMPLAAHAELQGERIGLRAAWGDPQGAPRLLAAHIEGDARTLDEAERLGLQVADQLKSLGAH